MIHRWGQQRRGDARTPAITWAGRIMVFYGAAHTIAALTLVGAARHAGAWFRGDLRSEDLSDMSAAGSAYWLSLSSFGPPLFVLGLTVLWMDRRGITPPPFIAGIMGLLTVVDAWINPLTPWPLFLLAMMLLLAGARQARHRDNPALSPAS